MSGIPTRRWTVSGHVQGVGYRMFALRAAEGLGVRGYARNLPDGTVEVAAAGDEESLRRLEDRLRKGPPASRVDAVSTSGPVEAPELPFPFEIRV